MKKSQRKRPVRRVLPLHLSPVKAGSSIPSVEEPADTVSTMDRAVERIARWREAPWEFVRDVFGVEPDPWQDEFLHALVENDKLALKACKGPGKSCAESWAIWWFMTCFTFPKILCTSITFENLRDGLWSELAKWRAKSEILKNLFEHEGERIYARSYKELWFAAARTWPKDADKTRQADTLAGQHAQHTMIVLDEAGGIPVGVLAAGLAHHSTQDPNAKEVHITILGGNPNSIDSALGWACLEDAKNWWVKEITGDPDDPKRAPRIDRAWALEQIDKFGKDNPWVLVNVFGKFPPIQANKLLGPDVVREAMRIEVPKQLWWGAPKIMSLDVARSTGADRSVLCRRQGPVIFPFRIYRIDDLMQLAGQVAFEWSRWPADVIFVDMVGLGGGVLDRLKDLGLPAVGVNCGLPSADPRFADKRTEMWWKGAQAIKGTNGIPSISLPNEPELVTDLCGPEISFNEKGKMKLESKEHMKKRGLDSPDIGDALMQTWAEEMGWKAEHSPLVRRSVLRAVTEHEFDPFDEGRL